VPSRPLVLRARTVVPDPASSLDDGAVLVHDGRIVRVGRWRGDLEREPARVRDLGDAALLPGLVNAHAHLDLTCARGRFAPTSDFVTWIQRIRPFREANAAALGPAVEEGARELLAGGCTLVADHLFDPAHAADLRRSGIRAVAFLEVLEFRDDLAMRPLAAALDAASALDGGGTCTPGLAPHTPYTVRPEALRAAAREARARGLPITVHAGETEHEVAWLLRGEGPLAPALRPLVGPGWTPPGARPVRVLHDAGLLEGGALLAHGNHLDGEERRLARESGSTVVHCPGSHAFFGHGAHPVAALRADGVPVALGTDSLASHPDGVLSMAGELRRLAALEPGIAPRDLLAMATLHGAAALGFAGRAGILRPGAFADMAAFTVPGGWKGVHSLLDPALECVGTLVGGVLRVEAGGIRP
jgi:cytosine/adenosine deaminase-related metal-dependent hydrolase